MLKYLLPILFIILTGCNDPVVYEFPDIVQRGLDVIVEEDLQADLYYLASDELEGRGTGQPGGDKAAQFIAERFEASGLLPAAGEDGYFQYFHGDTQNVIGYFEGNDPDLQDETIVIGGHYDHLGIRNGQIYNGADDNASGTVAVMATAKAVSRIKYFIKRRVVFIAFGAEEIGLVGSSYYTNNPLFPLANTVYMINLDMVGYLRGEDLNFLGGREISDKINAAAEDYDTIDPDISSSAGGGSDHVPFGRAGVENVFLHTGSHANYHKPSDDPEKINYESLTDVTKVTYLLYWLIDADPEAPDKALTVEDSPDRDHGWGDNFPQR